MSAPEKPQPRAIIATISTEGESPEHVHAYIEAVHKAWISAQNDSGASVNSEERRRGAAEREADMRVHRLKRGDHQAILMTVSLNSPGLKPWMESLARLWEHKDIVSYIKKIAPHEDRSRPNRN